MFQGLYGRSRQEMFLARENVHVQGIIPATEHYATVHTVGFTCQS